MLRSVSSDPLSHLPTPRESLCAVTSLVFCLEINQVNRKILAKPGREDGVRAEASFAARTEVICGRVDQIGLT